jgi:aryl-alcohol dehydrogenase-like predicted oxidoreductase
MKYRIVGRTGLKVSEIGFGAWAIGGPAVLGDLQIGWGKVNDSVSLTALETAFDLGINFYDTADVYGNGHSEELIGKAFHLKRDKVIIASKGGNRTINEKWVKDFSDKWITEAVEQSLKRLQTDYIDVYQLHTPGLEEVNRAFNCFDCLEKLKAQGKIRFYGISISPINHGIEMIKSGKGDVIQVVYNILNRQAENELFPLAEKNNIGIIVRVPLASGFLTGKFTKDVKFPIDDHRSRQTEQQIKEIIEKVEKLKFLTEGKKRTLAQTALQFILHRTEVSVIIPGAKTSEQVIDNAKASDIALLTEGEIQKVYELASSDN